MRFGVMRINGKPGFLGNGLFLDGSAAAPSAAFLSEPSLGLYRAGVGILGVAGSFTVSGTSNFTGKVTITSPLVIGTPGLGNGYISQQGAQPGGLGGSRNVWDWSGDGGRWFSYGADNATNGTFLLNSQRANGAGSLTVLAIDGAGNITTAGTTPGTSTTAASILGKSLGLTENLFAGGLGSFTGTVRVGNYTVAGLPSAVTSGAGAFAFVTDATLTAITGLGLAPVGGGANKVPVYSDGAQWLVI